MLTRCYGIEGWPGDKAIENQLWTLAEQLLPDSVAHMAAYTQGLMDLGSLLCVRSQPRCGECPMADGCVRRAQGRQRALPTARPRKAQPLRSTVMLLARNAAGEVWLQRRPDSGVGAGCGACPSWRTSAKRPLAGGGGLDSGAADAAVAHRAACVHPFSSGHHPAASAGARHGGGGPADGRWWTQGGRAGAGRRRRCAACLDTSRTVLVSSALAGALAGVRADKKSSGLLKGPRRPYY